MAGRGPAREAGVVGRLFNARHSTHKSVRPLSKKEEGPAELRQPGGPEGRQAGKD